jgi:bacterial leucyl aminopeptidase
MQRSLKFLLLALTAAGCATADDNDLQTPEQPAEEGMKYISIGADALVTAQMALDEHNPGRLLTPVTMTGDVAILAYDAKDLGALSELMHARHSRCAGFIVHDSLEEAQGAVKAKGNESLANLAVSYTIDNGATVNGMLTELQEPRIRSFISSLSAFQNRYYTSSFGVQSSDFIFNQWSSIAAGRSDITVQRFTHTWAQSSIILTITGTSLPNEVVVVGGHQDSIASGNATSIAPGADDDASGIATITEVLRAAIAKNYRPARTIKLMAYAAEEVGLRGSAAIAADYVSRGVNVVGVIQFDMTGFKGSTKDIYLMQDFTNAAQNTFVQNLITTYGGGATFGTDSCGYGCSDHASWHNRGFPTSMPFESTLAGDNKNIHTPNDTLANMGGNANQSLKFSRLGVAYIGELAKGTLGGTPGNTPPTVSITAPAGGSTQGASVTFTGSASDAEDGSLSGSIRWTDSVSGLLGTGSTITATLSGGAHTVTASVTDSAGSTTTSTVSFTVSAPGCDTTYTATGLPLSIPDNNATGITSNLAVANTSPITSLALSLNISHTYRGDLVVSLLSPTGTTYSVSNRSGGSADNIILTAQAVTAFNGQSPNGTWQMKVQDRASVDTGALNSWSIKIGRACP